MAGVWRDTGMPNGTITFGNDFVGNLLCQSEKQSQLAQRFIDLLSMKIDDKLLLKQLAGKLNRKI